MKDIRVKRILILTFLAFILMFLFETKLKPSFWQKSLVKWLIFTSPMLIYSILSKKKLELLNFKDISFSKLSLSLIIALLVYFGILLGYYLLKDFIDLDLIRNILLEREKISGDSFIYVALYISIFNSLLEEVFFRGFMFEELDGIGKRSLAYIWSSLLFAIYHISIIDSWFSPLIFGLALLGLFLVGLFFAYLTQIQKSFIGSWLVHISANLAINTIGFMMFGII